MTISGLLHAVVAPLLAVCVLLLLGLVCLYARWRRRTRVEQWALVALASGAALLLVLSLPVVATTLARSLEHGYQEPPEGVLKRLDVIVALSGGFRPGDRPEHDELTRTTLARVTCGARAWHRAARPWLVVSGRSHRIDGGREGRTMAALAHDLGVPQDRILRETRSRTTFEHPHEVLTLPQIHATDVLGVATSAWHMRRATTLFRQVFQVVIPIPCDFRGRAHRSALDYLPQAHALSLSTTIFHEYAAMLWYRLGLASLSKP